MKYTYISLLLLLAGWVITACEENPDYFEVEKAPSVITFEGFPAFSGSFATTDDIAIPVAATNASEIVVARIVNYSVGDEPKTINEVLTTLSGPEATLNTTWDEVLATPEGVGLASISSVQLNFNTTVDGQETFKTFPLEFFSPLTLGFTEEVDGEEVDRAAPITSFRDSVFSVYYNVSASQTPIEKVEFFTKVNESGTFSSAPIQTVAVNDTDLREQTATFTFPGEDVINPDSVYTVQIVATAANGNTATEVVEVQASEIPLDKEGEFTLRPVGYELAPGITDSLNQAFDFSQLEVLSSATITDNPELIDLTVVADNISEELAFQAAGGTEFVVASDAFSFEDATYEAARDAFATGAIIAELADITSLPSDQVVIVRIGDVSDANSRRYAIMRIANVLRGFDIDQSEVTITYRAR